VATTQRSWQRRYPPLLTVVLAVALVALVMPSALRLPQSNPREVPEFAPVPGQQKAGNAGASFDGLGAAPGSGSGPAAGPVSGAPPTPPPLQGIGKNPVSKQCVGNPPRQTEDKLSPPCVAYFKGDNGGATAIGVTRDMVTVVVYVGSRGYPDEGKDPASAPGCGVLVDLATTDRADYETRWWRAYMRYFNERYQTYGRTVRIWLQTAVCVNPPTSVTRRADAQAAWERLRPFAVLTGLPTDARAANTPYLEVMNSHGVVTLPSPLDTPRPRRYYNRHPGLVWSYQANLELTAQRYARWVCQQVVPFDASFTGDPLANNNPRVLGQLYADTPEYPEISENSRIIAAEVKRCGGTIVVTRTISSAKPETEANAGNTKPEQEIALAIAEFKRQGVTTVLWTGLVSAAPTKAAAAINYNPEWVVQGLLQTDSNTYGFLMDQSQWSRAWVQTEAPYIANYLRNECVLSAQSADPGVMTTVAGEFCGVAYVPLRLLFTGIQVAGPRLTVKSVDEGFHAIPDVPSPDPSVPACYFHPGDYSCVKDAIAQWWDPSCKPRSTNFQGCYRIPERGRRFLLDQWPRRNVDARRNADEDVRNEYS